MKKSKVDLEDILENDDDIEDMVNEKKRNTRDLTLEIKRAKDKIKDDLENTKVFEPSKEKEIVKTKKKKTNKDLSIVGEIDLLCVAYYIYLLLINQFMKDDFNYIIPGCIIIFIVLLFGISIVTSKKISKFINIFNILGIIVFIVYNVYYLI